MIFTLIFIGFIAGALSSAIGFGGGMILLPVVTYFYGVDVAIPTCTIAQLLSNVSRSVIGFKDIKWKAVGRFLITAAPLTALGAFGFAVAPKALLTKVLSLVLIVFAIMKILGKLRLPNKPATMLIGGGITGLINGLMGISGPLSSAVFLTLDLSPVAYIASEATAAAVMHIVKIFVYGKLDFVTTSIVFTGLGIAAAIIVGNYISMKTIKNIDRKKYKKIVAGCMIILSLYLFIFA